MADIIIVAVMSSVGLPGLPSISMTEIATVLVFSPVTCFAVNDFVKVALIRSAKATGRKTPDA